MSKLDFFARMFDVEQKPIVDLDPETVSPDIFEDVLDFTYTSKLSFTEDNAELICFAAKYFGYEQLLMKTEDFLK